MRTQAVYIVTGKQHDCYFEQLIVSACSLKRYNSDIKILVVTDDISVKYIDDIRMCHIKPFVDEFKIHALPPELNMMQRSRFLKTSLRSLIEGDFVFLDTDTVITGTLDELDAIPYSIAAVLDKHVLLKDHSNKKNIFKIAKQIGWNADDESRYFNSGFIYVKDNQTARNFFNQWHKYWITELNSRGICIDQPAFALANAKCGYPIHELSGIYNCQIVENGLKFLYSAKVIHYFASNINAWQSPYLFRDKLLYAAIRNNGMTQEILAMIENAKSQFASKTLIVGGNVCDCYYSTLSGIARRIFMNNPKLNNWIDKTYENIRNMTKCISLN